MKRKASVAILAQEFSDFSKFTQIKNRTMAKSMKKSMKKASMKKAMKGSAKKTGMKRKAMKKSVIAKGKLAKSSVFRGTKAKTSGGLKKSDLVRSKTGKIVSKKASENAKKNFKKRGLDKWIKATQDARKALGIKGFCPIGGKSAKGQALLKKVRSLAK